MGAWSNSGMNTENDCCSSSRQNWRYTDRKTSTYILPGTRIISDQWAGYNGIAAHPNNYTHLTVNHTENCWPSYRCSYAAYGGVLGQREGPFQGNAWSHTRYAWGTPRRNDISLEPEMLIWWTRCLSSWPCFILVTTGMCQHTCWQICLKFISRQTKICT